MPIAMFRMFVTMFEVHIPKNYFDEDALFDIMDSSGDASGAQPRRKNSFIPSLEGLAAMFAGQSHASETMDFAGADDADCFSTDNESMASYMEEMDQPGPMRADPMRRKSVFKMMSAPDPAQLEIPEKHRGPSRRVSCGDAPHDINSLHQLQDGARHGMIQSSIINWLAFKPQSCESINEDIEPSSSPPSFQAPPMQSSTPIKDAALGMKAGDQFQPRGLRSLNAMAPSAW